MNQVAQYILSVTGAAMLGAILKSLAGQGSLGALIQMLTGIFLALTILAPVVTLELPDPTRWFSEFSMDGQALSAEGEALAADAMGDIITARVEAYILDKAALYQARITAAVTLDETGQPYAVRIQGDVSPDTKSRLEEMLENDLGIKKEAQQWE